MDSMVVSVMTPMGKARQLGRAMARSGSVSVVTSRIGYTRRDGVRVVRSWDAQGRMKETKERKLDI